MAAPLYVAAGAMGVLQGGLSAFRGKEEREAQNARVSAQQQLLRGQVKGVVQAFELQTYSKYLSSAQAGAERLSRSLASGGTGAAATAHNYLQSFITRNDLAVATRVKDIEVSQIQAQITNLEASKAGSTTGLDFMSGFISGSTPFVPAIVKSGGK